MGQELESMEKFLGTRNLEGGPCYESPRKERVSCAFEHLISNIKLYNKNKDINSTGD